MVKSKEFKQLAATVAVTLGILILLFATLKNTDLIGLNPVVGDVNGEKVYLAWIPYEVDTQKVKLKLPGGNIHKAAYIVLSRSRAMSMIDIYGSHLRMIGCLLLITAAVAYFKAGKKRKPVSAYLGLAGLIFLSASSSAISQLSTVEVGPIVFRGREVTVADWAIPVLLNPFPSNSSIVDYSRLEAPGYYNYLEDGTLNQTAYSSYGVYFDSSKRKWVGLDGLSSEERKAFDDLLHQYWDEKSRKEEQYFKDKQSELRNMVQNGKSGLIYYNLEYVYGYTVRTGVIVWSDDGQTVKVTLKGFDASKTVEGLASKDKPLVVKFEFNVPYDVAEKQGKVEIKATVEAGGVEVLVSTQTIDLSSYASQANNVLKRLAGSYKPQLEGTQIHLDDSSPQVEAEGYTFVYKPVVVNGETRKTYVYIYKDGKLIATYDTSNHDVNIIDKSGGKVTKIQVTDSGEGGVDLTVDQENLPSGQTSFLETGRIGLHGSGVMAPIAVTGEGTMKVLAAILIIIGFILLL